MAENKLADRNESIHQIANHVRQNFAEPIRIKEAYHLTPTDFRRQYLKSN